MKNFIFCLVRSHSLILLAFAVLILTISPAILVVSGEEINSVVGVQADPLILIKNNTNDVISKSELSDLQSSVAPPLPVFEDDDMSQWTGKEWIYKKELKGYLIVSNDLRFLTKLLHKRKILKVRIPLSSARITESIIHRRDVEIKASTWNKVSRVKIRVPFGFTPQELRVIERPTNIDIYAPYSFIEFEGDATSESPKKKYKPKDKR